MPGNPHIPQEFWKQNMMAVAGVADPGNPQRHQELETDTALAAWTSGIFGPDLALTSRIFGPDMALTARIFETDMALAARIFGPDMALTARIFGPDMALTAPLATLDFERQVPAAAGKKKVQPEWSQIWGTNGI